MQKTFSTATALLFLISCASHPQRTVSQIDNPSSTVWVDSKVIRFKSIIPGPPALHSPESDQDFATLETLQKNRTAAECARAKEEQSLINPARFFQEPRGPLTEAEAQATLPFINEAMEKSRQVLWDAKNFWSRPRPYITDKKLHPCVKLENSSAYPSGHSGTGELVARILSDVFPSKKEALLARGVEIGQDRLIGGVHHPSDVRDARILVDRVYEELQQNPEYLLKVETLKKTVQ